MIADRTARKQRGVPFPPGKSGNAAGRPRGARNRFTIMAQVLSHEDVAEIVSTVIAKAKRGDMVACVNWPTGTLAMIQHPLRLPFSDISASARNILCGHRAGPRKNHETGD